MKLLTKCLSGTLSEHSIIFFWTLYRLLSGAALILMLLPGLISCGDDSEDDPIDVVKENTPEILYFTPISGFMGDTVRIYGSSFAEVTSVKFDQLEAAMVSISDTIVVVLVPEEATSGNIQVLTPNEEVSTVLPFSVLYKEPILTSFSPEQGAIGDEVQISGEHFFGEIVVKFGALQAEIVSSTSTLIVVKVPLGAEEVKLTVSTTGGSAVSEKEFEVIDPTAPVVTSISPRSGVFGDVITITGANLGNVQNFKVGFQSASIISSSATSLQFEIPEGARIGFNPLRLDHNDKTILSDDLEFYVVKTHPDLIQTFDGDKEGYYIGSKRAEEHTFFGQSNELAGSGALYMPPAIDGNYFHQEGFSTTAFSGSWIAAVAIPSRETGFYASFVGDSKDDEMYVNIQVHIGELPNGYGSGNNDFVMGLRVRFADDIQYQNRITLPELQAASDGPDANGWYSASFPVSGFVDFDNQPGDFDLTQMQRINVSTRRNYGTGGTAGVQLDGSEGGIPYSFSFDNLIVTIGGPYSY